MTEGKAFRAILGAVLFLATSFGSVSDIQAQAETPETTEGDLLTSLFATIFASPNAKQIGLPLALR